MNETEKRIARTEALFRSVNERIAKAAKRFDTDEATFVCECADQQCAERVDATLEEYERVRSDATQFLLRPGHEDTRVERVVERADRRLAIVKKVNGAIAGMVRRLDPRAEPV